MLHLTGTGIAKHTPATLHASVKNRGSVFFEQTPYRSVDQRVLKVELLVPDMGAGTASSTAIGPNNDFTMIFTATCQNRQPIPFMFGVDELFTLMNDHSAFDGRL